MEVYLKWCANHSLIISLTDYRLLDMANVIMFKYFAYLSLYSISSMLIVLAEQRVH